MMNKNDREEFYCVILDIILLFLIIWWGVFFGWNEQFWVIYFNFKVVIIEIKFYELFEYCKIFLKFVKYLYLRCFVKEDFCLILKKV